MPWTPHHNPKPDGQMTFDRLSPFSKLVHVRRTETRFGPGIYLQNDVDGYRRILQRETRGLIFFMTRAEKHRTLKPASKCKEIVIIRMRI